jgi:type IV secretory pathway VirB2 component (pilin)
MFSFRKISQVFILNAAIIISQSALAASSAGGGSGLPWEAPLDTILKSIQGPVARVLILLAIIITGIMFAFGEHGSGFKKILGIACGGAIVLGAVSFMGTLFGATF